MSNLIDFTDCEIKNTYLYSGANGKKIGIKYNNNIYMLKFPSLAKIEDESYSNSVYSEYISCQIFSSLGFNTQETILGKYRINNKEKIVCACKDFTTNGYELKEFAELKNSVLLNSSSNGYGTELSDVLETIKEQKLIDSEILKEHFWNMFIVDALLGNFDRHNGNWGILINRNIDDMQIAPIYDCGSCLFPQLTDQMMKEYINNEEEINKRIYIFPNSILKINDKKINYYEFISSLKNEDCNKAVLNIFPKIQLNKINAIIDNIDILSDIRKEFYKKIIIERYSKILEVTYNKLKAM